jgi:hypothetical protein
MFALRCLALASGLFALIKALLALSYLHSHLMILATACALPAIFSLTMATFILGAMASLALLLLGLNLMKMSAEPPADMANTAVSILQIYLPAYLMLSGATTLVSSTYALLEGARLSTELLAATCFGPARVVAGLRLFSFSQQHLRNQHPDNPEDQPLTQFVGGLGFQA